MGLCTKETLDTFCDILIDQINNVYTTIPNTLNGWKLNIKSCDPEIAWKMSEITYSAAMIIAKNSENPRIQHWILGICYNTFPKKYQEKIKLCQIIK